ncbi:MAG: hypothetical protein SCALA702_22650 [Melioribacteraceae bacterium]|nr:MAG: hypothetical protein SCALA702_22650 [Melioribacteraceae bacterium]
MKKFIYSALIIFLAITVSTSGQLYKDSWKVGFGGFYPRLVNTNVFQEIVNFGAFGALQYDITESSGLRGTLKYLHLNNRYNSNSNSPDVSTDLIGGNFDFLYHIAPCEDLHPFLSVGIGAFVYFPNNSTNGNDDMGFEFEISGGFGAQYKLDEEWFLTAEMSFHIPPLWKLDGNPAQNNSSTIIGGSYDSYVQFKAGALYQFDFGEESRYCELYTGITARSDIDYEKIEQIVKKYIPEEVVKEVVVEKPVPMNDHSNAGNNASSNWILVGVNFDFNSTKLAPESYPILFHAVQVLLQNPSMRVEIQGHTDNIGSEKFNKKVSENRANAVKNYLVAKGIDPNRLEVVGYGESNPIADNKSADGRALNRRIEFKVLN